MKEHDISLQVWNRPEWTKRVLESLDKNTDWDLVNRFFIMDDASEKATENIVRGYKNPKKVHIREKFGNSLASLKKFVSLANTELVFNYENDVLAPKNWNRLLAQEFEKNAKIGIIRGVAQDISETLYWSTCHAGFRLGFLKSAINKLETFKAEPRWTEGNFLRLLNGLKIHCVPNVYFDKLEFHKEEQALIHQYFLKGWERRDIGWDGRDPFYKVTQEWRAKRYIK